MNSAAHSPASALVAHAEGIIADGRVLVIGNAHHLVAPHLLERGARLVQVLDPEARRVAHAAAHNAERRVSYAQLTDSALRDASFDCALVEDLSAADDPAQLLRGVRRALGPAGVAFVATASADGTSTLLGGRPGRLSYGDLEELVEEAFEASLMLAQSPFIGYSVVALDLEAPPEPTLDNGFLGGSSDQADYFVAVCGSREAIDELELDDMTIVQLPAGRMLDDGAGAHREQERRATKRAQDLESELRTLRQRAGAEQVEQLTRELERRDGWIRELEARAESADARADDAEAELERLGRELERSSGDPAELARLGERLDEAERRAARSQKEAKWAEDRVASLEQELEGALCAAEEAEERAAAASQAERKGGQKELERARHELERARHELASAQQELDSARATAGSLEEELSALEAELEDTHAALLAALADRARAVAEAASNAATATAASPPSSGSTSSPELAEDVAQLEAQLLERGEHLRELERQLSDVTEYGKTLAAELASRAPAEAGESDEVEQRVDALERALAEREADLVAAAWTIAELEKRLQNVVA
jgi:SAM-dependent methyltransferase